jgi:hypothetical protein
MSDPITNWTHTFSDGTIEKVFVKHCSCGGFPINYNMPWEKDKAILLVCAKCGRKSTVTANTLEGAAALWNEGVLLV